MNILKDIFSDKQKLKAKLHFVWFVDTTRTRSYVFSLQKVLVFSILLFLAAIYFAVFMVGLIAKQEELRISRTYVLELKKVVLEMQGNAEMALLKTLTSAKEISPHIDVASENEEPKDAPASIAPNSHSVKAQAKGIAGELAFSGVKITKTGDNGIFVNFILTSLLQESARYFSGKVCVVAYLRPEFVKARGSATFPVQNGSASGGCSEGLGVRFVRLRPTEISLKIPLNEVSKIEIRFHNVSPKTVYTHIVSL